ncbi:MAG: signal peptide peptidase SppA [candidate division Zixibacteria bacterium]
MRCVILWSVIFFLSGGMLSADPVDGLEFQSESVATAEYVTSGVTNPAGLSFYSAMGVRYTHSFTDSTYGGDDALLIGSRRGFFGLEWLNHTTGQFRRKYTFAMGDRIATNFYLGFSYSWFGGADELYKKMKNWKIGMLYRPRPSVSFGLVVDRLNQPRFGQDKHKRLYRPGMAVHPFSGKITLSYDLRWIEEEFLNKSEGNLRVAMEPYRGIHFSADYRTEGSFRIGLTVDFERMKVGSQGRLNNSRKYVGGSYFVEFGEVRYNSVLPGQGKTGTMTLGNNIIDEPERKVLFASSKITFLQMITALRKGAGDDRIHGLLLKIDEIKMSFAVAQEIRSAVTEFRKNGKNVTVYLENGGNLSYYLASAADKIIINPTGYLMLNGLSARATFYKGMMDKLGVKATVIRTGPHKTAGNAFTEEGLTDAAEEQINWLLDDLYDQMIDGISNGRKVLPGDVKRLINDGPYTARAALEANLVDDLRYYDELVEGEADDSKMPHIDLTKFYKTEDYNPRWSEPRKIAVVYAGGAIVAGNSGNDFIQGKVVGGNTLAKSLASVRKDKSIEAVVLRVDSPGGDLFGSDRIYRELELLKGKKPLVVTMGGVAASGGYYISCPGDEILASPGTITGSIGVIMGKVDLSGFYDKIGLKKKTLKRGKHADITSMDRPATNEEIEHVEKQIWHYYNDFVSKVSTWRKIDFDSVDAIGQGRVWTGRQAIQHGLIDSYGGIWEAIEQARQKAGIEPEEKLIIDTYPKKGFSLFVLPDFPMIGSSLTGGFELPALKGWQLRLPFDIEIE